MRLKPTHTYEVIASALKAARPPPLLWTGGSVANPAMEQWKRDVRALAHALRADNRSFRLDVFFQQCGLNDE